MKPIAVSTTIARPRAEVYAFLDVLGNHERFTDHILVAWSLSGPRAGVGASLRVRAKTPGPAPDVWVDMTVVEADEPSRIVERSVSAKGRRSTLGTYTLEPRADGGTEVRFEIAYESAPLSDRLAAPLGAAWVRKQNARAMERLKALMESGEAASDD